MLDVDELIKKRWVPEGKGPHIARDGTMQVHALVREEVPISLWHSQSQWETQIHRFPVTSRGSSFSGSWVTQHFVDWSEDLTPGNYRDDWSAQHHHLGSGYFQPVIAQRLLKSYGKRVDVIVWRPSTQAQTRRNYQLDCRKPLPDHLSEPEPEKGDFFWVLREPSVPSIAPHIKKNGKVAERGKVIVRGIFLEDGRKANLGVGEELERAPTMPVVKPLFTLKNLDPGQE